MSISNIFDLAYIHILQAYTSPQEEPSCIVVESTPLILIGANTNTLLNILILKSSTAVQLYAFGLYH